MKKKLAFILGGWAIWIFLMTLPAFADGGPHRAYTTGTPGGSCASCHRAHTAAAPDLLKETQPQLCYACHGDTALGAGTNVEGGVYYAVHDSSGRSGTVTPLRAGGFRWALIDSAMASTQSGGWATTPATAATTKSGTIGVLTVATRKDATSAHTVDPSVLGTMWGNGLISGTANAGKTSVSMTCGTCHDPHGNTKYRMLRPVPNGSGVAAVDGIGIADTPSVTPSIKSYTTTNYWNVEYAETPGVASNISAWCSTCHTRYLAGENSGVVASGDAVFKYRHQTTTGAAWTPICIQCHVAHGSDAVATSSSRGPGAAQFVELPGGTPGAANPNDSRLLRLDDRGVCQMCHLR